MDKFLEFGFIPADEGIAKLSAVGLDPEQIIDIRNLVDMLVEAKKDIDIRETLFLSFTDLISS